MKSQFQILPFAATRLERALGKELEVLRRAGRRRLPPSGRALPATGRDILSQEGPFLFHPSPPRPGPGNQAIGSRDE